MRITQTFTPIAPDEIDDFAFNFAKDLTACGASAASIASTNWNCTNAGYQGSPTDPTPQSRILVAPQVQGTLSVARLGTMIAGVTYSLEAVVTLSDGRILSLNSQVACVAP